MNRRRLEGRAARHYRLKDYRRAAADLEEIRALVGDNPDTLHMLARCHLGLGETDRAFERALDAERLHAAHFGCLRLLTDLSLARGETEHARAFAERALAAAPAAGGHGAAAFLRGLLAPPGGIPRLSREEREWVRWARDFVATPPA